MPFFTRGTQIGQCDTTGCLDLLILVIRIGLGWRLSFRYVGTPFEDSRSHTSSDVNEGDFYDQSPIGTVADPLQIVRSLNPNIARRERSYLIG